MANNHNHDHDNVLTSTGWFPSLIKDEYLEDGVIAVHIDLPKKAKRYTKRLVRKFDNATDVDMAWTDNAETADIRVKTRTDLWDQGYLGLAYWENDQFYATIQEDIVTNWVTKRGNNTPERRAYRRHAHYVITHELLHTFGMEHPYGDGYNPNYDTSDTAMSYNCQQCFDGFTDIDLDNLRTFWETPV